MVYRLVLGLLLAADVVAFVVLGYAMEESWGMLGLSLVLGTFALTSYLLIALVMYRLTKEPPRLR